MKRFIDYIGSRRFAIYLLLFTTAVVLLSTLLPDISHMDQVSLEKLKEERPLLHTVSETLRVERLARKPYFQVIPAFIFLSIFICTFRRIRKEINRVNLSTAAELVYPTRFKFQIRNTTHYGEPIRELLEKKRWRLPAAENDENIIYGIKGERGIFGSYVFHAGMEIVLLGVFISFMFGAGGLIFLTEGFPVKTPEAFIGIESTEASDFPFEEIMLQSYESKVDERGFPLAFKTRIVCRAEYGPLREYLLLANKPVEVEGYKLIFTKSGFAPHFVLSAKSGEIISDSVVNLAISMPKVRDSFDIRDESLSFSVELFPDYYEIEGRSANRGRNPKNPAIFVVISRFDKELARGFIKMGEKVDFDDYQLEFKDLKYWVELAVSKDRGVLIIGIGFIMVIIGLSVRFILNERRISIIMTQNDDGKMLEVGGKADYFPDLFSHELEELSNEINEVVNVEN